MLQSRSSLEESGRLDTVNSLSDQLAKTNKALENSSPCFVQQQLFLILALLRNFGVHPLGFPPNACAVVESLHIPGCMTHQSSPRKCATPGGV